MITHCCVLPCVCADDVSDSNGDSVLGLCVPLSHPPVHTQSTLRLPCVLMILLPHSRQRLNSFPDFWHLLCAQTSFAVMFFSSIFCMSKLAANTHHALRPLLWYAFALGVGEYFLFLLVRRRRIRYCLFCCVRMNEWPSLEAGICETDLGSLLLAECRWAVLIPTALPLPLLRWSLTPASKRTSVLCRPFKCPPALCHHLICGSVACVTAPANSSHPLSATLDSKQMKTVAAVANLSLSSLTPLCGV